ncbi:MAG: M50 family metallopeptidase [Bacteroidota bacterium]
MKQQSKYVQILELIFLMVLLFGIMFVSTRFSFVDNLKPDNPTEKYIMLVGIVLMGFVVLGVHELGHLLVGLKHGFRFQLFVVGPLGIKREQDKVKVYLNKNLGYYGGIAGTSPQNDSADNAKIFARILLAGPIASVLFAILCFLLAFLVGKPLGVIFYVGALISIAIFLATTVPSRTGLFFTDRKRYQRLVTPGKDQEVELAMLSIMGKYAQDNSYQNVEEKDIDLLIADDLPFIQFFGHFNRLCYQLEMTGEITEAAQRDYDEVAQAMSENLVIAFNKEIDKLKEKLSTAN